MNRALGGSRSSWSAVRTVSVALLIAVLITGSVAPAAGQSAADQLCQAAGYGPGCIGVFTPRGMPRVAPAAPGVSPGVAPGPDMGGLLGGVLISILGAIVIDALTKPSTPSAPAPQAPALAPQRVDAFREAIEQQRQFQEERERQLLAKLTDTHASQLLDAPSGMTFRQDTSLESMAAEAGWVFDRGAPATDPHALWMSHHDPWFSTEAPAGAEQAVRVTPLPVTEQSLHYTQEHLANLRCGEATASGGRLCSFPAANRPILKLKPIAKAQPSPPGSPTSTSPPAPRDPGGVPLRSDSETPRVLGTGAPDVPLSLRFEAEREGPARDRECVREPIVDHKGNLVAAARQRWRDIAMAAENPRTYADILTTAIVRLGDQALPELAGSVASTGRDFYRSFMDKLICETLETVTAAFENPSIAGQKIDQFEQRVREAMIDSLPGGKITRLALTGRPEDALEEFKGMVWEDLKGVGEDWLKKRMLRPTENAPEWLRGAAKETLDAGWHWLFKVKP